jgi:hypothetical protein
MNIKWRNKQAANEDSGGVISPPDEDHYDKHGVDNLVIRYSEFRPALELDELTHKDS